MTKIGMPASVASSAPMASVRIATAPLATASAANSAPWRRTPNCGPRRGTPCRAMKISPRADVDVDTVVPVAWSPGDVASRRRCRIAGRNR